MTATLYVSRYCFLCKLLTPAIRWWFWRRGLALTVVRGAPVSIPATPALVVGNVTLVGTGILGALRAIEGR